MRKGQLFSAQNNLNDSIFKTASPYHTSAGRKVFSGGGIMPDIFVPADSSENTQIIQELGEQQLFTAYVVDHMEPLLNRYKSAGAFEQQYNVDDTEFDRFIVYASRTIREMDSHDLLISKPVIKSLLKASAARFKWGDDAYFEVMNDDDAAFNKAVAAVN